MPMKKNRRRKLVKVKKEVETVEPEEEKTSKRTRFTYDTEVEDLVENLVSTSSSESGSDTGGEGCGAQDVDVIF